MTTLWILGGVWLGLKLGLISRRRRRRAILRDVAWHAEIFREAKGQQEPPT